MRKIREKGCYFTFKGTNFLANHNTATFENGITNVVISPSKVLIFLQITTMTIQRRGLDVLLFHLQRY